MNRANERHTIVAAADHASRVLDAAFDRHGLDVESTPKGGMVYIELSASEAFEVADFLNRSADAERPRA